MTYDKIEKLMKSIDTLRVYTESRVHDLHSENLSTEKQDNCEEKIKRAKQEILDLFQEK
tara:strand:+ start:2569 stop:2745 length:177 start_codon:yes stop_codon:yes gene_type:complete